MNLGLYNGCLSMLNFAKKSVVILKTYKSFVWIEEIDTQIISNFISFDS